MLKPLSRKELIRKFKALGYSGPFSGESINSWLGEAKKFGFQTLMLAILR